MFATLYGKVLIGCLSALTLISFVATLAGKKSTDSYTSVVMAGLAFGLIELTWMAGTTDLVTFADNIVLLVGSIRVLFITVLGYMVANYFMTRNGRKLDSKILIFTLIQVIILVDVNVFYLLIFGYTAEIGLTKGSLYPAPYIIFALYGVLLVILLLTSGKKDIISLVCAGLMIIGGISQVLTEQLPCIYLAFILIVLIATFTLPNRKGAARQPEAEEPAGEILPPAEELTEQPQDEQPVISEPLEPQWQLNEAEEQPVGEVTGPTAVVSSVEQLPEYTFDFIDEALMDEPAPTVASEPVSEMPAEEATASEPIVIDDIPELKQIEELIESETLTDLPPQEIPQPKEPKPQEPVNEETDIQQLLNQISETISEDSYQEKPSESREVAENTSSSLAAIQQAYDREIEADKEQERKQQQRQQQHNEKIISKPVISPLGPVERPQPNTMSALAAVTGLTAAATAAAALNDNKPETESAESTLPQSPVSEELPIVSAVAETGKLEPEELPSVLPSEELPTALPPEEMPSDVLPVAEEPVVQPVIVPTEIMAPAAPKAPVSEVSTQVWPQPPHVELENRPLIIPSDVLPVSVKPAPQPESLFYSKPQPVAKVPLNEVSALEGGQDKALKPKRKSVKFVQTPSNLPSIEEIITASQIAHKQPGETGRITDSDREETPVEEKTEKKPAYRPRRRKSLRIMVIGSMSSEVRLISDALKKQKNYRVDVIDDGYLAMELLAGPFAKVFDAIVAVDQPSYSDIYATIRMVRDCEVSEIASLPIICIINDDPRRSLTMQHSGVDVFVKRPLSIDELNEVLREQLDRHGW